MEHFSNVIHVASLTNKQLLVEILVAIKSLGNEARQWLLTTSTGRSTFLQIGQRAAEAELLSSDWTLAFEDAMAKRRNEGQLEEEEEEKEMRILPAMSTSELLKMTMEEMPPRSHNRRLSTAIEMIESSSLLKNPGSLSVRQAAALVKASAEEENINLQTQVMSILLGTLPNDNDACVHALAAVQLPILQRLDLSVVKNALQCSQLDYRLAELFVNTGEKPQLSIDSESQLKGLLRILRHIEAADLARRGNQIGAKHGCVICVPNEVISKNYNLLRVMEKREEFNLSPSDTSTSYNTIIGRGWNHNVVLNGKGGRKRMIHSEVHAVADSIRIFGENLAFDHLFPHAVAVIVELKGDFSYDNAPPCPKCDTLLRAVGICKACHSTDKGFVQNLQLASPNLEFLDRETVRIPLRAVCDEIGVECSRLSEAEERITRKSKKIVV